MDSPHKDHGRGAFIFSLICASTNGWANNADAGDLRRHRTHYDVDVMDSFDQLQHDFCDSLKLSDIADIKSFLSVTKVYDNVHDKPLPLQWRHNERDGVSNHQPHDCLLNRLFRRRWKKTSKFRVAGLCVGNSPVTGEFPAQRVSNAENVSTRWRHHDDDTDHAIMWYSYVIIIWTFIAMNFLWMTLKGKCYIHPFTWIQNDKCFVRLLHK